MPKAEPTPRTRAELTQWAETSSHADVMAFLDVTWRRERRALPDGWVLVFTEQPRGAIAVYLCEAGSDDGVVACGWLAEPAVGADFPVWRVTSLT